VVEEGSATKRRIHAPERNSRTPAFSSLRKVWSGGPFVAPAYVSAFVDIQGNITFPLQSGTITWEDSTSSALNVSAVANGGTSANHTYGSAGSYTMTCVIVDGKGS
jgi:hypothetical protein